MSFGGQTHLVHDTKLGVWVVGPLKFSKISLSDYGVHLKGHQTTPPHPYFIPRQSHGSLSRMYNKLCMRVT